MNTPALDSIPIAIFAHDPACDLAGTLTYLDDDIKIDVSDPREVSKLLDQDFSLTMRVMDELNSEPFHEVHTSVMQLPAISEFEPWGKAERILSKYTNDWIAKAIISAVDRLATLIRAEKVASSGQPDALKLASAGPVKSEVEPQPRRPGRNDFSV